MNCHHTHTPARDRALHLLIRWQAADNPLAGVDDLVDALADAAIERWTMLRQHKPRPVAQLADIGTVDPDLLHDPVGEILP